MGQPVPYEFRDAEHLVMELTRKKNELAKWFDRQKESICDIVYDSVGSNTFRAFQRMPERPSVVFREWALRSLSDNKTIGELGSIRSQAEYDSWVRQFCGSLDQVWRKHMEQRMPYGPRRKLPNLLLKEVVLWTKWSKPQRTRLTKYLHVPLDRYTLVGIRHCIDDPEIPRAATMKFVSGELMYDQIQAAIRRIAKRAKVPAIYFDVLAWNMSH